MRRDVVWSLFDPTSRASLDGLAWVIEHMHPMDRREIEGLRASGPAEPSLVQELAVIHASRRHLDAYLIAPADDLARPCAFIGAYRLAPAMASLTFFATEAARRRMPAILRGIGQQRDQFGARHGVALCTTKALSAYRPALRWMQRLGGEVLGRLGPIGATDDDYVQLIWRL